LESQVEHSPVKGQITLRALYRGIGQVLKCLLAMVLICSPAMADMMVAPVAQGNPWDGPVSEPDGTGASGSGFADDGLNVPFERNYSIFPDSKLGIPLDCEGLDDFDCQSGQPDGIEIFSQDADPLNGVASVPEPSSAILLITTLLILVPLRYRPCLVPGPQSWFVRFARRCRARLPSASGYKP
jgi:hypothetical protein